VFVSNGQVMGILFAAMTFLARPNKIATDKPVDSQSPTIRSRQY
jgi:hypothetical protein